MDWLGLTLAYGLMFGVGSSVAQVAEAPFIPGPPGVSEPGLLQLAWPAFGGQLLPGLGIGLVRARCRARLLPVVVILPRVCTARSN
jgi:hypothetical protein